jgi:hypothetical protein
MTTEQDAQRRPSSGRRFGVQVQAFSSAAIAASRSRRASAAASLLHFALPRCRACPSLCSQTQVGFSEHAAHNSSTPTEFSVQQELSFIHQFSRNRCAAGTFRIVYLVTRENVITAAATN